MKKEILDDNYFEREDEFQDDIGIVDRWFGMFIEGFLIGVFAFVVSAFVDTNEIFGTKNDGLLHEYVLMFLFFVVLNKDFLNGQSIVKSLNGYQIIDIKTRQPASPVQCVVRNFTLYFNFLIVVVATIFPKRRLGDLLAGTKLVRVKEEKSATVYFSKMIKNKWDFKFWFSLVVAAFYSWMMVGGGFYFLENVFR